MYKLDTPLPGEGLAGKQKGRGEAIGICHAPDPRSSSYTFL